MSTCREAEVHPTAAAEADLLSVDMDLCKAQSHHWALTTSSMEGDVLEVGTCLPALSSPGIWVSYWYHYANTGSHEPCQCNLTNLINGL